MPTLTLAWPSKAPCGGSRLDNWPSGLHVPVNGAALASLGICSSAQSLKHASVMFVASPPRPDVRNAAVLLPYSLARTDSALPTPAVCHAEKQTVRLLSTQSGG